MESLRLLCVLAHPDDESLGMGGILARYGAEGVETYLVTATRGERGWPSSPDTYPGPEALGKIREAELRCAAERLGIRDVCLLNYIDGDLDQADPAEATAKIVAHLRRVRPQVVVTFDPSGAYGHPDHIAICQFTTAAVVCAADPNYKTAEGAPHRVSKLYYMADPRELIDTYQELMGELVMVVDGVERRPAPWEDWAITARVDAADYWHQVWQAIACHRSQIGDFQKLSDAPEEVHRRIWGRQSFYRAFSLVNGGRRIELDLFEGLR